MLSSEPPFKGASNVETLHAIMREPAPPLHITAPLEVAADLQRILDKCLAKEPGERYQGMRDLAVDLRAARRRLESVSAARPMPRDISGAPATIEGPSTAHLRLPRWWPWIAAAAAVLLLIAAAALLPRSRRMVPISKARPSVAVLYFENQSGDASLDWLRTGLTDMVVTDLSQSPQIRVLGTDRLYQVLTDLKQADSRTVPSRR
jgi:serine/threonine protein kinase